MPVISNPHFFKSGIIGTSKIASLKHELNFFFTLIKQLAQKPRFLKWVYFHAEQESIKIVNDFVRYAKTAC